MTTRQHGMVGYTVLYVSKHHITATDVEETVFMEAFNKHSVKVIKVNLEPREPLSSIPDDLAGRVDGLLTRRNPVREEDLPRFPKLKVVVRQGIGYDIVDRAACAQRGIKVANVPDYGVTEVADHAMALVLSLRRGIIIQHDTQRQANPGWSPLDGPPGFPMSGSLIQRATGHVFGIIGMGRIGTALGMRAKAFGWRVVFYDPYRPNGYESGLGFHRVRTLEDLCSESNVLSVQCPFTPETRNMINRKTLALLPHGSILVNVARGGLVDLDAVEEALRSGQLAGAGLDCLPVEPVPEPAPALVQAYRNREPWLLGRLVLTPHVAWYSPQAQEDVRWKSAETMRDILLDGLETNVIPPESY